MKRSDGLRTAPAGLRTAREAGRPGPPSGRRRARSGVGAHRPHVAAPASRAAALWWHDVREGVPVQRSSACLRGRTRARSGAAEERAWPDGRAPWHCEPTAERVRARSCGRFRPVVGPPSGGSAPPGAMARYGGWARCGGGARCTGLRRAQERGQVLGRAWGWPAPWKPRSEAASPGGERGCAMPSTASRPCACRERKRVRQRTRADQSRWWCRCARWCASLRGGLPRNGVLTSYVSRNVTP